ncbi:glycoside hydrolase family 30 protein [Baudoinia panamericana UAMH 10762]|uniref:Glycoside hydrolase family 30 protein n=1 Tax=Baudoinia panamericana (strain UAMH 10762) TaxID=717646 RepID=M2NJ11_BAUPA|nr:glycoside hydrolase family 30 protein [Baudoinia panamericana UAMH 10762]EMC99090.1 glycoside hydrolase family 30 protein [Baudoinia panamericana UAMH 10762]
MLSRFAAASVVLARFSNAWPPAGHQQPSGPVIHVAPNTKYQGFDGIGISEAFQRSLVLHQLDTPSQNLVLDYLFSSEKGAGMTILRNGLGSSPDQGWDHMQSIAPSPPTPNLNTSQLDFIPLPRDDQYQVWLSQQALARGVKYIYADAWSADYYMKTNNNETNGGYLCGVTNTSCATGDWRQAYANKITRYIQDYQAYGIKIDYVGFLNEPDLSTPYASMQSDGQQAADFLTVLYPTLQQAGISTQIACCDGSGWEENRERLTGIQAAGAEYTLGLVTAHGYSSAPGAPFATPKKVWQTEWSTFDNLNYNWYVRGSQSEGLTWANHIQQTFTVSNVTGFLYWWGAANATDNEPLIFINGTNEVSVTKRLWAHAHFGSRFIRQGASRIGATVTGDSTNALNVSAFANTDGSTAIQVINNGNTTETVTLEGLYCPRPVQTWLTNQANNLTLSVVHAGRRGNIVADVPAKSLLSFYV